MKLAPLLCLLALCAPLRVAAQDTPAVVWELTSTNPWVASPLALSPDGLLAASRGSNGVHLWRLEDGTNVGALEVPYTYILSLAFSPDGACLASSEGSVWRTSDWSLAYRVSNLVQSAAIAFSPDASTLAIGNGAVLEFRNATTGDLLRTWTNATGPIAAIAFSPDGTRLASGAGFRGADTNLTLWSVASGAQLWRVPTAQTYAVGRIVFSPDGATIATASGFVTVGPVQLWRAADGGLRQTLPESAHDVAFSPDGTLLLEAGTNLVFRQVSSGAVVHAYSDAAAARYETAIAFTPDGRTFLRARYQGGLFAARVPLQIMSLAPSNGSWLISWAGCPGRYQLQQRTNLMDPWEDAGGILTNQAAQIPEQYPTAFFRVIALP